MNGACSHCQHAPGIWLQGDSHSVQQVLRPIGRQSRRRTHGTGQHHGLLGAQDALQKPGSFFERVCAMGNDNTAHLGVCHRIPAAHRQCTPHVKTHVLAIDLRHLLCSQFVALQRCLHAGNIRQQLAYRDLTSFVAHVVRHGSRLAGNRATRAKNDDFLLTHLRTPKNWSKIQLLD